MDIETSTRNKLLILYMLNKVDFPLTNSQLSDFFISKGYDSYFSLQETISGLIDKDLISMENIQNTSYYHITSDGVQTLGFFVYNLPTATINEIDSYLMENKYELRNEVGTISDYYKSGANNYIVHCQVKEGAGTLIEINISVPTKEEAASMCNNWKDASQEIYANIMKKLMT